MSSQAKKHQNRKRVTKTTPSGFTRVPGAASYMDVGERTVREMIRDGRLPSYRPSPGIILLRFSDLDEAISKSRVDARYVDQLVEETIAEMASCRRGKR
jgi:excisionase family DNA binding protein